MARGVVAAMMAAFVAALFPSAASGCSCAGIDNPRAALASAEGAFVGTIERVDGDWRERTFHFRVERGLRGGIEGTVVVHTSGDGGSCGLEGSPGRRMGLFVRRDGARWSGSLCSTIDPDRLLKAAEPLPAPNGVGPPAFVVGNSLGDQRSLLLDARGRTLAYGAGPGDVHHLEACPGGARVIEGLGSLGPERSRVLLSVRGIEGFVVERDVTLGDLPSDVGHASVQSVQCRDPGAGHVDLAVRSFDSGNDRAYVFRYSEGRWREVWKGGGALEIRIADGASTAVLGLRDRVERLDLDTGMTAPIFREADVAGVAVSPDGTSAAVVTMAPQPTLFQPRRLVVVDVPTGAVRATHDLAGTDDLIEAAWLDDKTLAATGKGTLSFYDERLQPKGSVAGWSYRIHTTGGRAYGRGYEPGPLLQAALGMRAAAEFARLPDGATHAIAALPPKTSSAPAAVTSTTTSTTSPPQPVAAPPLEPASSDRPWRVAVVVAALLGAAGAAAIRLRRVR